MKLKKKSLLLLAQLIAILLLMGCQPEDENDTSDVPARPEAPVDIIASQGTFENQIQISWTASERATAYVVYKACDDVSSDYRVVNAEIGGNEYIDESPAKGRRYFFKIVAVNAGGSSDMSDPKEGWATDQTLYPPHAPFNVESTKEYFHHVYVRWSAVEGATKYHLYRSDIINGDFEKISPEEGIENLNTIDISGDMYSFDDDGSVAPIEGQSFYYKVSAENEDGEGALSSKIAFGWFPYDVPGAPTSVSATDGTYQNKIVISWNEVTEASSYKIYRREVSDDTPCDNPEVVDYDEVGNPAGIEYDDTVGIVQDQMYCYSIKSINIIGNSDFSVTAKGKIDMSGAAVPSAPTGTSATIGEENQITVSWTRADDLASEYQIYRSSTEDGDYIAVGTATDNGADNYNYPDSTVTVDTEYFYKVKAVSGASESSFSESAQGLAFPTVPPAPSVTATDGNFWNKIEVTWTNAPRATSYTIYRSTSIDGVYEELESDIEGFSYTDNIDVDIVDFITYYYKVLGVNTGGEGNLSNAESGNVELAVPTGVNQVKQDNYRIDVSWDIVDGADYYQVEYCKASWGKCNWAPIGGFVFDTFLQREGLPLGKYKHRVRAIRDKFDHEGPFSAEPADWVWASL